MTGGSVFLKNNRKSMNYSEIASPTKESILIQKGLSYHLSATQKNKQSTGELSPKEILKNLGPILEEDISKLN